MQILDPGVGDGGEGEGFFVGFRVGLRVGLRGEGTGEL